MINSADLLRKVLFLDIETASQYPSFVELPDPMQRHWKRKMKRLIEQEPSLPEIDLLSSSYKERAGIFAEFGRVVCISLGYLAFEVTETDIPGHDNSREFELRVKSIYGKDEVELLASFRTLLDEYWNNRNNQFICGHNIREFDIPFLCRRMICNRVGLPNLLQISGQRPWQISHLIDTMELWKFGDYKHYTSLDLLCNILAVQSPKQGLDGSKVNTAFWDGNISEIAEYCQQDVLANVNVFLRLKGFNTLSNEQVVFVTKPGLDQNKSNNHQDP